MVHHTVQEEWNNEALASDDVPCVEVDQDRISQKKVEDRWRGGFYVEVCHPGC